MSATVTVEQAEEYARAGGNYSEITQVYELVAEAHERVVAVEQILGRSLSRFNDPSLAAFLARGARADQEALEEALAALKRVFLGTLVELELRTAREALSTLFAAADHAWIEEAKADEGVDAGA